MSTISADRTVAELVVDRPFLTKAFEKLGIDFCCGGKQTLAQACQALGLDPTSVVQTLNALDSLNQDPVDHQDWSKATLTDLIDHIVTVHHGYLREELPRLSFLTDKVSEVHGPRHPSLYEVKTVFAGLNDELTSHLDKEEQVLFPAIGQIEALGAAAVGFPYVAAPIQVMEQEHDSAGQALEKLRQLTDNYTVPADACGSYKAMLEALADLEKDLHLHIHKENNILFPRAIALSAR